MIQDPDPELERLLAEEDAMDAALAWQTREKLKDYEYPIELWDVEEQWGGRKVARMVDRELTFIIDNVFEFKRREMNTAIACALDDGAGDATIAQLQGEAEAYRWAAAILRQALGRIKVSGGI